MLNHIQGSYSRVIFKGHSYSRDIFKGHKQLNLNKKQKNCNRLVLFGAERIDQKMVGQIFFV